MVLWSLLPARLGGRGHHLGGANSWAQLVLPGRSRGSGRAVLGSGVLFCPSLLRAQEQVTSVSCAAFPPPVEQRQCINRFPKWPCDLNLLFKGPCCKIHPNVTHAGLGQPMKVEHRQERAVKRCCSLRFLLLQPPGGWVHHLQVLSTKPGEISIYLLSLLPLCLLPRHNSKLLCASLQPDSCECQW